MRNEALKKVFNLKTHSHVWQQMLWYWLPIALLLTGIRTYKVIFAFIENYSMHEWSMAPVIRNWAMSVGLILIAFLIYQKIKHRVASQYPLKKILFLILVLAALLKAVRHILNHNINEFFQSYVVWKAFDTLGFVWELYRWDIVFLILYGFVIATALHFIQISMHKFVHLSFATLFFLFSLMASVEFAYYIVTGENGNGFLLQYVLTHFNEIAFILVGVFANFKALLLLFPFVLLLIPTYFRIKFQKKIPSTELRAFTSEVPVIKYVWLVWPMLTLAIFLPTHAVISPYSRYTANIYYTIYYDLTHNPFWAIEPRLNAISPADEKTSDTRNLKFKETSNTKKLNVVIFMLESTRNVSVTPYDSTIPSTPFLDSISKSALLIKDMYAVMPRTSGAWIAIINGMVPPVNSVSQSWVELEKNRTSIPSLPTLLRPFGYRSAFMTSERLDFQNDRQWVKNAKFDFFLGDEDLDHTGFQKTNIFGHEDRAVIKPSLAWIDSVQKEKKPFFLAYMTMSGHYPYGTPTDFKRVDFRMKNKELENYLNSLLYVDQCMKTLFQEFSKRGMMENTLFIILGDHGESFGEHGPRQHAGVPYDESLKIPCILYSPALWKEHQVIEGLRQQTDILPTIADALGFELKDGMIPGQSLLQPVSKERTLFYSSVDDNIYLAVRKGNLKHIYFFEKTPLEIYDLANDSGERNNLADQYSKQYKDSIELELYRWRKNVNTSLFLSAQGKHEAPKPN